MSRTKIAQKLIDGLSKVRPFLWWGFGLSSLVYFGIAIASRWPEWSPGASIIADFFSNLAIAYLGGFVFWLIIDNWEKQETTGQLEPIVMAKLGLILVNYHSLLRYGQPKSNGPEKKDTYKDLRDIDLNELVALLFNLYKDERYGRDPHNSYSDFIRFWKYHQEQLDAPIDVLLSRYHGFDASLTFNLEVLLQSKPTAIAHNTLLNYKANEEEVHKMQLLSSVNRPPEEFDQWMLQNIGSFSLSVLTHIGALKSIAEYSETLSDQSREFLTPILVAISNI